MAKTSFIKGIQLMEKENNNTFDIFWVSLCGLAKISLFVLIMMKSKQIKRLIKL